MTNLTQSLQEKAVHDYKVKFLDKVSEFDSDPGPGVSPDAYAWSLEQEETAKFISNLVAEVVEETEKRVREEIIIKINELKPEITELVKLLLITNTSTQPKEEKV